MANSWGQSSHVAGCDCPRCTGFRPGNTYGILPTHGAYVSPIRLGRRTEEIADSIRPYLPAHSPGFEPTLRAGALILARAEKAAAALEKADNGRGPELERLAKDLRAWLGRWLSYAKELGLTPRSAAEIMRDAYFGAASAEAARARLDEHLRLVGDEVKG
jgi:hypothetical protein